MAGETYQQAVARARAERAEIIESNRYALPPVGEHDEF